MDLKFEKIVRKSTKIAPPLRQISIPVEPELPTTGALNTSQKWLSLLWSIDTAQEIGTDGLRGLTLALGQIIQSKALKSLLFDARKNKSPKFNPTGLLWDECLPVNHAGDSLAELYKQKSKPERFDMRNHVVLPSPWQQKRLLLALGNLGQGKEWGRWKQDKDNHIGVAWLPWPIIWVGNGNHSTTAALLQGQGKFKCHAVYDISEILRSVTTDGQSWIRVDNGSVLGPVKSMAMAGIFVIGQRLLLLHQAT